MKGKTGQWGLPEVDTINQVTSDTRFKTRTQTVREQATSRGQFCIFTSKRWIVFAFSICPTITVVLRMSIRTHPYSHCHRLQGSDKLCSTCQFGAFDLRITSRPTKRRLPYVGWMPGQRLRRWPDIQPTLACFSEVFAEMGSAWCHWQGVAWTFTDWHPPLFDELPAQLRKKQVEFASVFSRRFTPSAVPLAHSPKAAPPPPPAGLGVTIAAQVTSQM